MNVSRETEQQAAISALLVDCKKAIPILPGRLSEDLMKHMEAVERAFKEPSNVIRIGDHQPEPVHYDLIQGAVKEAVREERS